MNNPPHHSSPKDHSQPKSSSSGTIGEGTAGDSVSNAGSRGKPISTQFGRYRIQRCLGEGAMGAVYLAQDSQLERLVALKIPKLNEDTDSSLLERFYREAKSVATLTHNSICPIYDVGEIDGRSFISMGYVDGKPLSDVIAKGKFRQPMRIAALVRKVALAMHHAHERGVVHRDLKPANIMIDSSGEPVIMDFGLARRTNFTEDVRLTQSGAIIGSPAYMSPEQVNGDIDRIGPQSDIYSLGITFYELLTGETPYRGSIASVMAQILNGDALSPSYLRRDLDPALESICMKMMAPERDERFATMKDVANELKSFLKDGQLSASFESPEVDSANESELPVLTREKKRRRRTSTRHGPIIGVTAFVLGIVVTIAVMTSMNKSDTNPQPEQTGTIKGEKRKKRKSGVPNTTTNVIGMKLVLIRAGEFEMGSDTDVQDADADEQPQHRVILSQPFYVGAYEVTQEQYAEVMGENPSADAGNEFATHPVNNVNWRDAEEFCRRLGTLDGHTYRLPTEAEWEYACRAGSRYKWACGNDEAELRDYAWFFENAGGKAHSVGLLKPNEFGLYDMHGNVAEWCQDWYDSEYYSHTRLQDPQGRESDYGESRPTTRVVRGGNWDNTATRCRSAFRGSNSPTVKSSRTGFRVVRLATTE